MSDSSPVKPIKKATMLSKRPALKIGDTETVLAEALAKLQLKESPDQTSPVCSSSSETNPRHAFKRKISREVESDSEPETDTQAETNELVIKGITVNEFLQLAKNFDEVELEKPQVLVAPDQEDKNYPDSSEEDDIVPKDGRNLLISESSESNYSSDSEEYGKNYCCVESAIKQELIIVEVPELLDDVKSPNGKALPTIEEKQEIEPEPVEVDAFELAEDITTINESEPIIAEASQLMKDDETITGKALPVIEEIMDSSEICDSIEVELNKFSVESAIQPEPAGLAEDSTTTNCNDDSKMCVSDEYVESEPSEHMKDDETIAGKALLVIEDIPDSSVICDSIEVEVKQFSVESAIEPEPAGLAEDITTTNGNDGSKMCVSDEYVESEPSEHMKDDETIAGKALLVIEEIPDSSEICDSIEFDVQQFSAESAIEPEPASELPAEDNATAIGNTMPANFGELNIPDCSKPSDAADAVAIQLPVETEIESTLTITEAAIPAEDNTNNYDVFENRATEPANDDVLTIPVISSENNVSAAEEAENGTSETNMELPCSSTTEIINGTASAVAAAPLPRTSYRSYPKYPRVQRLTGTVLSFNDVKEFGFIKVDRSDVHLYVNARDIKRKNPLHPVASLSVGERVEFIIRTYAAEVTGIDGVAVLGSPYVSLHPERYYPSYYRRARQPRYDDVSHRQHVPSSNVPSSNVPSSNAQSNEGLPNLFFNFCNKLH
jgi:cold shock CspA family protein